MYALGVLGAEVAIGRPLFPQDISDQEMVAATARVVGPFSAGFLKKAGPYGFRSYATQYTDVKEEWNLHPLKVYISVSS
jgi:non-ribosomal peptide synthetase component E (peptide arylation enzyme)